MNRTFLGDDSVSWGIGLRAHVANPPTPDALAERLSGLTSMHPHLVDGEVVTCELDELLSRPFTGPQVRAARTDQHVLVAAHHAVVDGLGLLAVLAGLLDTSVASSARGVGDRAERPFVSGALRRITEAVLAPPAVVPQAGRRAGWDVVAATGLESSPRSGELLVAVAGAVQEWNLAHGGRARRVAVAVGASRRSGEEPQPVDASAYLRLTCAERLRPEQAEALLREHPVEPTGSGAAGEMAAAVARALSRRLGSTVLVSHLGRVTAAGIDAVEFYPVTGGRSGVSLGAATVAGETILTLRARGGEHTAPELDELLHLVRRRLV
jgi:hypothetical protein